MVSEAADHTSSAYIVPTLWGPQTFYMLFSGLRQNALSKNRFSCNLFQVQLCTDWTIRVKLVSVSSQSSDYSFQFPDITVFKQNYWLPYGILLVELPLVATIIIILFISIINRAHSYRRGRPLLIWGCGRRKSRKKKFSKLHDRGKNSKGIAAEKINSFSIFPPPPPPHSSNATHSSSRH